MPGTDTRDLPLIAMQLEQIYLDKLRRVHWWNLGRQAIPHIPGDLDSIFPKSDPADSRGNRIIVLLALPALAIAAAIMYKVVGWQAVAFLLAFMSYLALRQWGYIRTMRLLRRRIEQSDILLQLVEGDQRIRSIVRHTPIPWRYLFVGYLPDSLHGNALLVAFNLDWYLKPESMHFRWVWIEQVIVVAVLIGSFVLPGGSRGGYIIEFILATLLASMFVDGMRLEMTITALIQQISEKFGGAQQTAV